MEKHQPTGEDLLAKIRILEERLLEAEETIQAIRSGEVDALVINKPDGEQLYTLTGADRGYRVLVESITEGALILSSDDSIYYCNGALGEMLGVPIQNIISRKLDSFCSPDSRAQLVELIRESRSLGVARGEFLMRRDDGTPLPVNVSLNNMRIEEFEGVCAIVTDLSEQKRVEEELRRRRTDLEALVRERTADLQREILERKRAEEDVRGQREWLRVTLTSIGDAVIATDAEARVTFMNPVAVELTGWPAEEARGKLIQEVLTVINEQTREVDEDIVNRVFINGHVALLPYHSALLTRSGREIPVEDSAAPIRDSAGNIIGAVLVFQDVTEKRRTQNALRESEERFRVAQELSPDGFTILRPIRDDAGSVIDFTWVYENTAIARMNGTHPEAVVGRRLLELFPGHRSSPFFEAYRQVAETGETHILEAPYRGESILTPTWFRLAVVRMGGDIAILTQDTTERKQAEEALRESNAKLEAALDSMTDAVCISDAEGRFIDFNDAFATYHRFKNKGECLKTLAAYPDIVEVFMADGQPAPLDMWAVSRALRGETVSNAEYTLRRKDTGERWVGSYSFAPIRNKDGVIVGSVVAGRDITEHKRMEEELRRSRDELEMRVLERTEELAAERELFFDVLETLPAYVCLLTPDYHVPFANQVFRDRFGASKGLRCFEHLFGRSEPCEICETFSVLKTSTSHQWEWEGPDGRNYAVFDFPFTDTKGSKLILEMGIDITERKQAEEAVKSERQRLFDVLETVPAMVCLLTPHYDVAFSNRSFREKFGESLGRRCYEFCFGRNEPCDFCESYKVLETGQPHHWEVTGPDGSTIDCHDFPFTDADGSPMILEMDFDITEFRRAEAELKATVAKLEQLNLELQEFAFIASHDLQEPLRKIQTFGSMLSKRTKGYNDPVGQDYMARIIKGANRMSELLRALLSYSRAGTSQLNHAPVSLSGVAKDAASDLEHRIIRVDGRVEIGELPTVDADASLLRQLFQNVIDNSIKYRKEFEPPVIEIHGKVAHGVCQVFIKDNGIGFDECFSQQIFKPFQRLHGKDSPYSGTGMGLAICKKIVSRHGGDITVNSTPGQGATFIVTLPLRQPTGA
jgi:PAS domain S-box-containing protein